MAIFLKNKAPYILSCALLGSTVLLSSGCSNDNAEESTEQSSSASFLDKTASAATSVVESAQTVAEETVAKASSVVEETKAVVETTAEAATSVIDETKAAVENTTTAAASVVDEAKTAVKETAEATATVAANVKAAVTEKAEVATEAVTEETPKKTEQAVEGAKVYANCSGCHGANGAGGAGPALNNQEAKDIAEKLQRYKAGEQIGPMSGMMQPIAKNMTDAEIDAVAKYAASLK